MSGRKIPVAQQINQETEPCEEYSKRAAEHNLPARCFRFSLWFHCNITELIIPFFLLAVNRGTHILFAAQTNMPARFLFPALSQPDSATETSVSGWLFPFRNQRRKKQHHPMGRAAFTQIASFVRCYKQRPKRTLKPTR